MALSGVAGGKRVTDQASGATQRSHLDLDPGLHLLQPPPFRGTSRITDVVRGQRIHDLLNREAELLELPSQQYPVHVALVEGAVAPGGARRRLQDAATLVEAHRVHRDANRVGKAPNTHAPVLVHHNPFQSVLTLDRSPEFTVPDMTKLLSITASPDAPVACDMTGADDTLAERLTEYRRLFDHALLGRESTDTTTTFRLANRPGVLDWVLDLVRREAACCPFLSYEVDREGELIVWTTSGGLGASDMATLDEFLAGHEPIADSSSTIAHRLEDRGGIPVRVPEVKG